MNLLFLEDSEPEEAPDIKDWPSLEHILQAPCGQLTELGRDHLFQTKSLPPFGAL